MANRIDLSTLSPSQLAKLLQEETEKFFSLTKEMEEVLHAATAPKTLDDVLEEWLDAHNYKVPPSDKGVPQALRFKRGKDLTVALLGITHANASKEDGYLYYSLKGKFTHLINGTMWEHEFDIVIAAKKNEDLSQLDRFTKRLLPTPEKKAKAAAVFVRPILRVPRAEVPIFEEIERLEHILELQMSLEAASKRQQKPLPPTKKPTAAKVESSDEESEEVIIHDEKNENATDDHETDTEAEEST